MNGMQMMLKSMGVDPAILQQQLTAAKDAIESKVLSIDEKLLEIVRIQSQHEIFLTAIGAALVRIEMHLKTLPQLEAQKLLDANMPTDAEINAVLGELSYGRGNDGNNDNSN